MEGTENIKVDNAELEQEDIDSTNECEKFSAKDYKVIIDMIKEVEDQYKTMKETLSSLMNNTYGLKPEVLEMVLPYAKEEIPTLKDEQITEFLNKYIISEDNTYTGKDREVLVETMTSVKDASLVLLATKKEADEIKESSNDVLKDYFNFMTSDKIKKMRENRLAAMKQALELETDEIERKKIQHMIGVIESTLNYSFIKSRFEKFGEKELDSIKEGYFNQSRGSYVINRFRDKIKKFGYNPDIYKYFFNLEENFLASKYSPFNNLFLFIYMRMTAYADPYNKDDKMMVQALTGALSNLVYHKFDSLEGEQFFLQVISEVLDKFIESEEFDYVNYFKENNTTYEDHPVRKEVEALHEKNRKESLIRMLTEMKISNFDESMTADELQDIYNKETELMIQNQLGSKSDDEELVIDNSEDVEETSEVDITPTIKIQTDSLYGEFGNKETPENNHEE